MLPDYDDKSIIVMPGKKYRHRTFIIVEVGYG
jgi:hypothetical protein